MLLTEEVELLLDHPCSLDSLPLCFTQVELLPLAWLFIKLEFSLTSKERLQSVSVLTHQLSIGILHEILLALVLLLQDGHALVLLDLSSNDLL